MLMCNVYYNSFLFIVSENIPWKHIQSIILTVTLFSDVTVWNNNVMSTIWINIWFVIFLTVNSTMINCKLNYKWVAVSFYSNQVQLKIYKGTFSNISNLYDIQNFSCLLGFGYITIINNIFEITSYFSRVPQYTTNK